MMTDPIADLLTRVRNSLMMKYQEVSIPYSKLKEAIVSLLKKEGFVEGYDVVGEKEKRKLSIALKYTSQGDSVISDLRRISKPSRRVYAGYQELQPFRSGMGVRVLSTPKGILSDREARTQKMGGEILLEVW